MIIYESSRTFNKINELTQYIETVISEIDGGILSIDGKDGSGKTYLSDSLSKTLNLIHINLDEFIVKKKDKYIAFINYEKLDLAIKDALIKNDIVIVDGVCVLSVLQKLKIIPKYSIYVKKTNNRGCWLDEHYFDLESSPEVVFKKDKEEIREFSKLINQKYIDDEDDGLFQEIINYHFDFKPHIKADIIFENIQPNCK